MNNFVKSTLANGYENNLEKDFQHISFIKNKKIICYLN